MNIFYFVSNRSDHSWYKVHIVALLEEDYTDINGKKVKSYLYLEKLDLNMSKQLDQYHSITFKHECSKNSCFGHGAKSRIELFNDMREDRFENWKPVSKRNYFRFRKKLLGLYHRQQLIDFSSFAGKQTYSVRQIL